MLTNCHAEVLDENGARIPGLYAIGNNAASMTGRYDPGAGATLGPAMTFGFVAANHACGIAAANSRSSAWRRTACVRHAAERYFFI